MKLQYVITLGFFLLGVVICSLSDNLLGPALIFGGYVCLLVLVIKGN